MIPTPILMAFEVVQRTREIGVRIAIGANQRDLLFGLLRLHAKPLVGGLIRGAAAAAIFLLFVRAVMFPVAYFALLAGFALGLMVFAAVAALAMLVPALRALRIDPSQALRAE